MAFHWLHQWDLCQLRPATWRHAERRRRLAALKLLAKQKRITKGTAIPCRVLDADGVDGAEASLAENIVRQDMHSADQFEVFHWLHQGGIGIEDIAARFGVSAHTVRQRLRLACVSPSLIHVYWNRELTLDHLTAFAVTEDQPEPVTPEPAMPTQAQSASGWDNVLGDDS